MIIMRELLRGSLEYTKPLVEALYNCTGCGYCQERCGVLPTTEIIETMKIDAVRQGVAPFESHLSMKQNIDHEGNVYGEPREKRTIWLGPGFQERRESDTLYFYGCASAYRLPTIAQATLQILNAARFDFTIMHDEQCCGAILLETGQIDAAKQLAKSNANLFERRGINKIITTCPGCYKTLKLDYPKMLDKFDIDVFHIVQLLPDMIRSGKIALGKPVNETVAFHDSCLLGRRSDGMYEQPREIIRNVPGIKLVEMPRSRHLSYCCGGGGGYISLHPREALLVAKERVEECRKTGADSVVVACPLCEKCLRLATKRFRIDLKVYSISELVLRSMGI